MVSEGAGDRREGGTRDTALTVTFPDWNTWVTSWGVLPIDTGRELTMKCSLWSQLMQNEELELTYRMTEDLKVEMK